MPRKIAFEYMALFRGIRLWQGRHWTWDSEITNTSDEHYMHHNNKVYKLYSVQAYRYVNPCGDQSTESNFAIALYVTDIDTEWFKYMAREAFSISNARYTNHWLSLFNIALLIYTQCQENQTTYFQKDVRVKDSFWTPSMYL